MNYIEQGNALASLSVPALLGVLVIALIYISLHFYKKIEAENLSKTEHGKKTYNLLGDIKAEMVLSNQLSKQHNDFMQKHFAQISKEMQTHCFEARRSLDSLSRELMDMRQSCRLKSIENNELRTEFKKRDKPLTFEPAD